MRNIEHKIMTAPSMPVRPFRSKVSTVAYIVITILVIIISVESPFYNSLRTITAHINQLPSRPTFSLYLPPLRSPTQKVQHATQKPQMTDSPKLLCGLITVGPTQRARVLAVVWVPPGSPT